VFGSKDAGDRAISFYGAELADFCLHAARYANWPRALLQWLHASEASQPRHAAGFGTTSWSSGKAEARRCQRALCEEAATATHDQPSAKRARVLFEYCIRRDTEDGAAPGRSHQPSLRNPLTDELSHGMIGATCRRASDNVMGSAVVFAHASASPGAHTDSEAIDTLVPIAIKHSMLLSRTRSAHGDWSPLLAATDFRHGTEDVIASGASLPCG